MNFIRETLAWDASNRDPAALCGRLVPGRWAIEAGYEPPPWHDPARLLSGRGALEAIALSLGSATALGLDLGPVLAGHLAELGVPPGPLAGVALHELIVNAAIHGNLDVGSGRSAQWWELAERQSAIIRALADPVCAARVVTVAIGWHATDITAVIADEGDGYDTAAFPAANRGSGRGLSLARLAGHVDVGCGGRQTTITLARLPGLEAGPP